MVRKSANAFKVNNDIQHKLVTAQMDHIYQVKTTGTKKRPFGAIINQVH